MKRALAGMIQDWLENECEAVCGNSCGYVCECADCPNNGALDVGALAEYIADSMQDSAERTIHES